MTRDLARPYPGTVNPDPLVPDEPGRTSARGGADSDPTTVFPAVPAPLVAGEASIESPDGWPTSPFVAPSPESPPTDSPTGPSSRRRRVPRIVVALAVPLVLLVGLSGYLVVATHAHERASAEWHTLAERKADELATTQKDLDGVTSELTAVREQLATATTRITELANEKAQIGDEVATQQQLADYQKRVGAAAATVASALDRCVTAQQTLIGYLRDAASYDSTDLARYSSDVDALCRSAQNANTSLQTELTR